MAVGIVCGHLWSYYPILVCLDQEKSGNHATVPSAVVLRTEKGKKNDQFDKGGKLTPHAIKIHETFALDLK
jgi:hypothetical protein